MKCSFIRAAAVGQKTASLIKGMKLMNVEHRTFNIEHRILYSACREPFCRTVYFKTIE
ncbi:hypothetical protein D1AOALGA4SA_4605 [Olavius algarvensis Delta 1 endosymbiont]|nr:hypothetical protein D1AOALGA4SA_4605 [Olavius algarvensis Delta 1 endosymbiont]